MSDQKWHSEFVQWKAIIIITTIMIGVLGVVYGIAVNASTKTIENKGEIKTLNEIQELQFTTINDALKRIENALGTKVDK